MRKPFLDNLRYALVLTVIVYHVFYLFNSVGVITNVAIPGIPALDIVEYTVYPWMMACMFLISGICARYSLERKSGKAFLKSKLKPYLLPSIAVIFLYGWTSGWVTNQYSDLFAGNADKIPGMVKYLIWCLCGIGVTWYLREMVLLDAVLVLIRKVDKQDALHTLGAKAGFGGICLLWIGLWASAQILNTPLIEVYRNGFYLFVFLCGYAVFSHDHIQELLARKAALLLALTSVLAVVYIAGVWGTNYARLSHLKEPLTNLYAWFGCLTLLGCGKRWMDEETAFTRYMCSRSFGFYILHYPLLALGAYMLDRHLNLPVWAMYPLLLLGLLGILPPLVAAVKRLPILRTLILGE